jgi:hypothetical protein
VQQRIPDLATIETKLSGRSMAVDIRCQQWSLCLLPYQYCTTLHPSPSWLASGRNVGRWGSASPACVDTRVLRGPVLHVAYSSTRRLGP